MGTIIYLSRERIQITLYSCRLGWGKQRAAQQAENERILATVNGVVKELGTWYFEVRVRSWPAHFFDALLRGGWWAPIVMVDRTVFSQGCVPDRGALRAYLNQQIHLLRPRLAKSS